MHWDREIRIMASALGGTGALEYWMVWDLARLWTPNTVLRLMIDDLCV